MRELVNQIRDHSRQIAVKNFPSDFSFQLFSFFPPFPFFVCCPMSLRSVRGSIKFLRLQLCRARKSREKSVVESDFWAKADSVLFV
jgi:hypothetical protein